MKVKPVAILLSAAMILMMASSAMSARQTWKGRMTFADTIPYDTIHLGSNHATDAIVGDSVGIDTITMTGPDTLHMDSLTLASTHPSTSALKTRWYTMPNQEMLISMAVRR